MTPEQRLENALRSADATQGLRTVVRELAQEGRPKAAVYQLLEKLLMHLRGRPDAREANEEIVLAVMDALTGWCHPEAQLLGDDDSALEVPRGREAPSVRNGVCAEENRS